jgi:DNA-binding winged helix-turn-helix (wHTH) protein
MKAEKQKPESFGPFTLDSDKSLLIRDGVEIRIGRASFRVLRALLDRRGEILSKDEIKQAADLRSTSSAATVVTTHITELLRALGPYAFYIEKVHGRGCRLIADVEVPMGDLSRRLNELCGIDPKAEEIFRLTGYRTAFAIDCGLEIHRSPEYRGWTRQDVRVITKTKPIRLPRDLQQFVKSHRPKPPNNKKYALVGIKRDSSEDRMLEIELAPTDYFSTDPIERFNRQNSLRDEEGHRCSPFTKYGRNLLNFESSRLPRKMSVEVTVELANDKLLLTRREETGLDWELGKWSLSFEEQMNAGEKVRRRDNDLFDTVLGGLEEELGRKAPVSRVRILSLMLHTAALSGLATAFVSLPEMSLADVRAHWDLQARDKYELKELDQISWTIEALAPMLMKVITVLPSSRVISPDSWHWTSRSRALAVLFHKYGVAKTLEGLSNWRAKQE